MARMNSDEAERAGVLQVVQLMAVAARTAPKTRGVDSIQTLVLDGDDLPPLVRALEAKVADKANPIGGFHRDALCVARAGAVLLIGVTGEPKKAQDPLNCGGCGYPSCAEFNQAEKTEGEDYRGPLCMWQSIDLGIALGSAVKTAAELNVDNRMMYTLGAAARKLGLLDCDVIVAIPLSVAGKNPFFDRAGDPSLH